MPDPGREEGLCNGNKNGRFWDGQATLTQDWLKDAKNDPQGSSGNNSPYMNTEDEYWNYSLVTSNDLH